MAAAAPAQHHPGPAHGLAPGCGAARHQEAHLLCCLDAAPTQQPQQHCLAPPAGTCLFSSSARTAARVAATCLRCCADLVVWQSRAGLHDGHPCLLLLLVLAPCLLSVPAAFCLRVSQTRTTAWGAGCAGSWQPCPAGLTCLLVCTAWQPSGAAEGW